MTNDQLVEKLQRMRAYSSGPLTHDDREVLQAAVAAIRTPDTALAEAMPHLSTLSDLLKVVIDPKKCEAAVARLTELANEASATRKAAAEAAAHLENRRLTVEPRLKAEEDVHARKLANERSIWEKQVEATQQSLSVRTAAAAALEQQARAELAAAEKLRAELETKLAAIRSAAA
jgi:hypothetical protein